MLINRLPNTTKKCTKLEKKQKIKNKNKKKKQKEKQKQKIKKQFIKGHELSLALKHKGEVFFITRPPTCWKFDASFSFL